MYIDKELQFSTLQAVTVSAASTNYLNQEVASNAYNGLWFAARVGTAFTVGTSMTIDIQTDDNSNFSSPKTVYSSGAILEADLTANKFVVKVKVPSNLEKYVRIYYTVVGTHSTGTIDAFFTSDIEMPF